MLFIISECSGKCKANNRMSKPHENMTKVSHISCGNLAINALRYEPLSTVHFAARMASTTACCCSWNLRKRSSLGFFPDFSMFSIHLRV